MTESHRTAHAGAADAGGALGAEAVVGSGVAAPAPGPLHVAAAPMLAVAALLLAVSSRYGPHWDELYFAMLAPQWWYDDQPPLTVWLTWLATRVSDELWVQRLPAMAAAVGGAYVAGLFPRALGAGPRAQRLAAWAHAFTVYPLLMGHLFTTAAIDLLAWQVVILLVLRVSIGHPRSLAWAGAVAGVACWNKLLVVVLVAALFVALLATDRGILRTRHAAVGAGLFVVIGGPQVLAQVVHGVPMAQVSAGLGDQQGTLVRLVALPALALFVGPPLLRVWLTGLVDPWRARDGAHGAAGRFLLPTVVLLLGWTLAAPSQPYYPVAAALPALAMGWASPNLRARWSRRTMGAVILANGVVAALVCLPLLPGAPPWSTALATVNPTIRDQLGWPDYARQIHDLRGEGEDVVVDLYPLAGAVHRYGDAADRAAVHSGHNALWSLGPPRSQRVLLVGEHAVAQRASFRSCRSAGTLRTEPVVHPQLAGTPLLHCAGPVAD